MYGSATRVQKHETRYRKHESRREKGAERHFRQIYGRNHNNERHRRSEQRQGECQERRTRAAVSQAMQVGIGDAVHVEVARRDISNGVFEGVIVGTIGHDSTRRDSSPSTHRRHDADGGPHPPWLYPEVDRQNPGPGSRRRYPHG